MPQDPTIPTRRSRPSTGIRSMLTHAEANNPGLIGSLASDALREIFIAEGGLPGTLHVAIGPNTEILRPQTAGSESRPQGYAMMLQVTFSPSEDYEKFPQQFIEHATDKLHAAWKSQHSDHVPGAFRAETKPNGDYTITIAHTDIARLTNILNKVLRTDGVRSLDTRLMGLTEQLGDMGTGKRSL